MRSIALRDDVAAWQMRYVGNIDGAVTRRCQGLTISGLACEQRLEEACQPWEFFSRVAKSGAIEPVSGFNRQIAAGEDFGDSFVRPYRHDFEA
jgi:hypothetical protein